MKSYNNVSMNINISNIITDGRLESNTRLSPVEIGYEGFKNTLSDFKGNCRYWSLSFIVPDNCR